ncbi:hypothetical protein NQZ68_034762 [Dissostichus eleginoides]|nr:hypothetical protein NQZ68_034762 [Dissostichus eleginoides]
MEMDGGWLSLTVEQTDSSLNACLPASISLSPTASLPPPHPPGSILACSGVCVSIPTVRGIDFPPESSEEGLKLKGEARQLTAPLTNSPFNVEDACYSPFRYQSSEGHFGHHNRAFVFVRKQPGSLTRRQNDYSQRRKRRKCLQPHMNSENKSHHRPAPTRVKDVTEQPAKFLFHISIAGLGEHRDET